MVGFRGVLSVLYRLDDAKTNNVSVLKMILERR
jgi:hypothetical protein